MTEIPVSIYRRHDLADTVWAIGGQASGFTAVCRCQWTSPPYDTRSLAKRSWEAHVLAIAGIHGVAGTPARGGDGSAERDTGRGGFLRRRRSSAP